VLTILVLVLAAPPTAEQKAPPAVLDLEKNLDPFIAKLIKPDANDTALLKLQKERVHTRAIHIAKWKEVLPIWSIPLPPDEMIQTQDTLWENLAELAVTPEDKIKCAEMHFADAKWFEHLVAERVEVGTEHPKVLNKAKARRLDAEIDLLKLKESLKDKK
jgi:hypothetical protein